MELRFPYQKSSFFPISSHTETWWCKDIRFPFPTYKHNEWNDDAGEKKWAKSEKINAFILYGRKKRGKDTRVKIRWDFSSLSYFLLFLLYLLTFFHPSVSTAVSTLFTSHPSSFTFTRRRSTRKKNSTGDWLTDWSEYHILYLYLPHFSLSPFPPRLALVSISR